MPSFNFFNFLFGKNIFKAGPGDLIIGTFRKDDLRGDSDDNVILGLFGDDKISGGDGEDRILGGFGDDVIVGNKGNDKMFGGKGNDQLVWNNGDGSDLMNGGKGHDTVQVNFSTDLSNDDLQNKDVATFSVSERGVEFARTALNDQTERGLFQLDIRNTEELETNFGGGDDAALIVDDVLDQIRLDLDGGDGVDLLDFSGASAAVDVNLATGVVTNVSDAAASSSNAANPNDGTASAINFEDITGTDFDDVLTGNDLDNVIRGGAGNDVMRGGEGADTFVFFEEDSGVDVILDFEVGVDRIEFRSSNASRAMEDLMSNVKQTGDDLQFLVNDKAFTIENTALLDFSAADFFIM